MANTLADRATNVAELMKRSTALGMAASMNEDGSFWLHGSDGTPDWKIGNSALEAVQYLKNVGKP